MVTVLVEVEHQFGELAPALVAAPEVGGLAPPGDCRSGQGRARGRLAAAAKIEQQVGELASALTAVPWIVEFKTSCRVTASDA